MDPSRLDPALTRIHEQAFVARGAVVIGEVDVGADASLWYGVILRGDGAPIRVGARANVQDGSVLHVDEGCPCILEEGVTVGHACIVHGCTIGKGSLVGMGSIVMNDVRVGEDCLIGAGSLLTEGKVFPPRSLILGRPAKVVRQLTDADVEKLRHATEHYVQAGRAYRQAGQDQRGS